MRFTFAAAAIVCALASIAACGQPPAPLVVPGPTTARPEDLRPVTPPPPPVPRVAMRTLDARVVSFRIVFAAGSADDPGGKEGVTELTANLMTDGGTTALSYADLEAQLYPLAASIRAEVDRDETVFTATVPAASLDRFYPLLRDVILAPRFDAESFTRIHARQTSELTSGLRGEDDEALGKEALQALLYEGHPYGHPTVGTERGLSAITLDDIHAQYARAFCRQRVLAGIAGAYPEGFDDTLIADLSKLPLCAAERASLPAPPARDGNQLLVVDKLAAGAPAISIGFTTAVTRADTAEFPGLLFAADALGMHRQSNGLLYRSLRVKRGLNYGDYTYAEFFRETPDTNLTEPNVARRQQYVSLWLRPVKRANASFALRAALHVYSKLIDDGVTDAELARIREFLTRHLALGQQTESRRLGGALDDKSYGLEKPYQDELRAGWAELDAAKLKALLPRVLETRNLAIAIVTSDARTLASELLAGGAPLTPAYDAPKPPEIQAEDREIAAYPLRFEPKGVRVVPVAEMFK